MGQQTPQDAVTKHKAFFEQLIVSLAGSMGVNLEAQFDHLGLTKSERQVATAILRGFVAQEDALRHQSDGALKQVGIGRENALAAIRGQRAKLMADSCVNLLQQIGPGSAQRSQDMADRVEAVTPKRLK